MNIKNKKDFAYLLGAFMGDGCVYTNKKRGLYQFSITSEDEDFCKICQNICKTIFGKCGRIKTIFKKQSKDISYYQLVICSKKIVYFLKKITNNKNSIPYNDIKKYTLDFCIGLMDADGWICKVNASDGYIRYRTGFKNTFTFTDEIRELFIQSGIKVGKLQTVKNYRKLKQNKNAFCFVVNTKNYCQNIGFRIKRKQDIANEYLEKYGIKNEQKR